MSKHAVNPPYWTQCATGIGLLLMVTNSAISMEGSSPAICMAREVDVTTLIEGNGETGDLTPDKLGEVRLILLRAGAACSEGRVGEAVALYESILALGTILGRRTQSEATWVPQWGLRDDYQIHAKSETNR